MAVEVARAAGGDDGFAPLTITSLPPVLFLMSLIGDFFPFDCGLPGTKNLVSISTKATSENHNSI